MSVFLLSNREWGAVLREVWEVKRDHRDPWHGTESDEVVAELARANRSAYWARYRDGSEADQVWREASDAAHNFAPDWEHPKQPWLDYAPASALRCVRYNTVEDATENTVRDLLVDAIDVLTIRRYEQRGNVLTEYATRLRELANTMDAQ